MSDWLPIELLPNGRTEGETVEVKRRFAPAPVAAFWYGARWIYSPHWDDYPGEEVTHFRMVS